MASAALLLFSPSKRNWVTVNIFRKGVSFKGVGMTGKSWRDIIGSL